MTKNKTFWTGLVAASALAVAGCASDDNNNNGGGGMGGMGGMGGSPVPTANVTAVHLAPEIPSADNTAVALFVNGEEVTALGTLSYSQSTGKIPLPATTYESIGVGVPGADEPVKTLDDVTLNEGDDLVVIAYRTGDDALIDFFVIVNDIGETAEGSGLVFVGHGADEPALNPVDVSLGEEPDCSTLIPGFEFGTVVPDEGLALAEGEYQIGFDLTPEDDDECADFGPVPVPVTADVVSILVAVDEDTDDADLSDPDNITGLNPELWAIIPDLDDPQPIRTIQTGE